MFGNVGDCETEGKTTALSGLGSYTITVLQDDVEVATSGKQAPICNPRREDISYSTTAYTKATTNSTTLESIVEVCGDAEAHCFIIGPAANGEWTAFLDR